MYMYIYYSNVDKHYYINHGKAQCTEPTPLALDNFRQFSSNAATFPVVMENAACYIFMQITHIRQWNGCLVL